MKVPDTAVPLDRQVYDDDHHGHRMSGCSCPELSAGGCLLSESPVGRRSLTSVAIVAPVGLRQRRN